MLVTNQIGHPSSYLCMCICKIISERISLIELDSEFSKSFIFLNNYYKCAYIYSI